jgi:hypothetical protein
LTACKSVYREFLTKRSDIKEIARPENETYRSQSAVFVQRARVQHMTFVLDDRVGEWKLEEEFQSLLIFGRTVPAHSVHEFDSVDAMSPGFNIVTVRTCSQLAYPFAAGGTQV